jgi:putative transposase
MIYVLLRTGIQWNALPRELGASSTVHERQDATGKNPTDRAKKSGTKRSLLTDGAGIPLAVVVDGANRHDSKLFLAATLDGIVVARPVVSGEQQASRQQPQHLCLDAGYDSERAREEALSRGYEPHIRPSSGKEKEEGEKVHKRGAKARRWVVERTHSWLNRSRRLLVRWEKKAENYLAFVHLACAQLIFSKLSVSG